MSISALWAGWDGPCEWNFEFGPQTLGLVPEAYRESRLKQLMRASDFAEMIGVSDIITHVGFLPENICDSSYLDIVAALRYIAGYMKDKQQFFLFETGQETPVTLLRTIEMVGLDNLGINFDTANLILYGKANSVDALDILGRYVRNTHIKDGLYPTSGRELGKETPLGKGKANITEIISKLKALGFKGALTIEREIEGSEQIRDILSAKGILDRLI